MNKEQFWKYFSPLQSDIFGLSMSILKNQQEAQDAIHEVLLKLWKKRKHISSERNIKSLTLKTTKNHCIDVLRKKQRNNINISANDYYLPDYEQVDLVGMVKKICQSLPEQQRMVIELKDFGGYTYQEISEIMEISIPTLRVLLSRARKRIIKLIENETERV